MPPYGGVSRPFKKIVASCGLTGNIHSGCYGVRLIPIYHSYPRIYYVRRCRNTLPTEKEQKPHLLRKDAHELPWY